MEFTKGETEDLLDALEEAIVSCKRAIRLQPDQAEVYQFWISAWSKLRDKVKTQVILDSPSIFNGRIIVPSEEFIVRPSKPATRVRAKIRRVRREGEKSQS